ncbi:MAG: Holliday junction resolvase RuvX [Litorivicinus sp.]
MTYLGFDYGLKRIGVATGQALTGTATPQTPLHAANGHPDWDEVERLIDQWQPEALVVGLPLNMDGSDNPITLRARKFAKRLHGRFHLTCHLVDERLSTREARERTGLQGRSDRHAGTLDSAAACIIVEQFLDSDRP